ncbi:pilus assembly protein TadG-related protein [Qipengyuania marisflavi]|uniref:Putative Flp pilus-assembly TadG-like N-terminal domain-containing protein n=1 Tax=Qipengyuania marisflavi TaxID=2486356 RepID=A0A5S3Q0S8_9SPHN|nr:pilus assembly protein TadG-related protein [Qipengyuania marisflavi]TMM49947.1 hypothetical protein FEV51_01745 [Qipengyuania marisflavi]
MSNRITRFLRKLRIDASGNAMMLVAMGAPILIGTTGMGVDMAQYYLIKRELQYAADQAALAGAWARGNGDTGTTYKTRANQEFNANTDTTDQYSPTATPSLAPYNSIADNSVVVAASATVNMPFASFILKTSTTIAVSATATWETTDEYTACLFALDPHASQSLLFSGGPDVNAGCGVGAISDASDAVHINGNSGTYDVGWVISGGGVSDQHDGFGTAPVVENMDDLYDPFDHLTPPDNPTPQSLNCGSVNATAWTADESRQATLSYKYYRGQNTAKATAAGEIAYTGANRSTPGTAVTNYPGEGYATEPVDRTETVVTALYKIAGSGPDSIWEEPTTVTNYTFANKTSSGSSAGALPPGTYTSFNISCDTVLAGGVYVIDGGELNVNANYSLTGSGVMFVLKNGAGLKINGGAYIDLSPMTANQLIAAGVSSDDAQELEGMLIFEDPNSAGTTGNRINGDANTHLNGVVYLPNSGLDISGSMTATSECLMIASRTLTLSGGASVTTLCPAGEFQDIVVGAGGTKVRLVA